MASSGLLLTSTKIGILMLYIHLAKAARKWDYEPISFVGFSSDESQLKFETKVDRMGRSEWGISGNLEWKYDASEETMVEAVAYRSTNGEESDYKLLPWTIPKQPFYDYLNTYYKDVIVKNLGGCSNLPQFEGKFQPPWPKDTYKLDKCQIDGDGLPEYAPPGFYKIVFTTFGKGQPSWGVTAIFKLTNKMF
ncbi:uncharacterized protein LOC108112383 [Drosophila eugracilis]|uniref:uncharacterized protein LOC108112383 n=1 Tax=Drosophila eugracilis TaxID=29029 RepID=UPI0007E81A94|nr:uncharacterized protein LOC108112383 [Drosophila eugracilis]